MTIDKEIEVAIEELNTALVAGVAKLNRDAPCVRTSVPLTEDTELEYSKNRETGAWECFVVSAGAGDSVRKPLLSCPLKIRTLAAHEFDALLSATHEAAEERLGDIKAAIEACQYFLEPDDE